MPRELQEPYTATPARRWRRPALHFSTHTHGCSILNSGRSRRRPVSWILRGSTERGRVQSGHRQAARGRYSIASRWPFSLGGLRPVANRLSESELTVELHSRNEHLTLRRERKMTTWPKFSGSKR